MGNSAIITVLGLLMVFGIISSNINRRSIESNVDAYGYVKYGTAKDIARTAIRVTLRRIDTLNVLQNQFTVNGSLFGGTYTVNGTAHGDTVRLRATGRYIDTLYTVQSTIYRTKSNFPSIVFRTALGINASPVTVTMDRTALIDARDHDSTGALTPLRDNDVLSLIVKNATDSSTVYKSIPQPETMLLGKDKISVDPTNVDLSTFAEQVMNNSDYTYVTPKSGNLTITRATWGSPSNPVIVVVDGRDTNTVKFSSNSNGYGILLVRGGVIFQGTMTWKGLVVVYGGTTVGFQLAGTSTTILGSSIFVGVSNTQFTIQRGAKILYSRATLNSAKNIPKLPQSSALRIVDWYE